MTDDTRVPLPPGGDTKTSEHDDRPKVRVALSGGSYHGKGELHIDIHGLDQRELELMQGAMHGHQWVTCINGRIEHIPSYRELPSPVDDEVMLPFWRRPRIEEEPVQLDLFYFDRLPDYMSPSITIKNLCGYHYSAQSYQLYAGQLLQWGFECMRSQRDDRGQFHEHWFLPGLWAAKEELKTAIDALDPFATERNSTEEFLRDMLTTRKKRRPPRSLNTRRKRELETAISFLCHRVQFGTLDVSIQRAAMTVD